MLAPAGEPDPAAPDDSLWNRRLVFSFDGGVGIGHFQGTTSTGSMLPTDLLGKGYGVMWSSGTRTSTHYNLQVGGETALMLKEHTVEAHGVPDYTVAVGGSGGAIQQYVYAQNHPGLIDAAIPQYSYSDMVTQTIHVGDCELLEHYFDVNGRANPRWKDPEVRQAIMGLNAANFPKNLSQGEIDQWNGLYGLYGVLGYQVMDRDPASPAPALTECRASWFGLTPLTLNPTFTNVNDLDKLAQGTAGVEWTHWGDTVNIYGRGDDGFARVPWDNVGVQYGLRALVDGVITPADFLDLNAQVGSWKNTADMVPEGFPFQGAFSPQNFDPWSSRNMNLSPDGGATPAPRHQGDPDAMRAAYTSGMEFEGDIDIPIIDWRHYLEDELDMHHSHQSFATRQRMLNADGDASNQVIWFTDARPARAFDQTPMAFEVIDEWMTNIAAHPERSVARNKPAGAVDSCFDTNGNVIASGAERLGRRARRSRGGRLHPALPDLLVVPPPGGRAVRGRRVEVPAAIGRPGDPHGPVRGLAADRHREGPPHADLPRRRVRLHQARRRQAPGPQLSSSPGSPSRAKAMATVDSTDEHNERCFRDVAPERLPLALAELHRSLPVGGVLHVAVCAGDGPDRSWLDDDRLRDLLVGAGFELDGVVCAATGRAPADGRVVARARRARTLPDTVGPRMSLLICGLNPSLYAADAGVAFARPGNRFWPAALAAGLVSVDRDPDHALRHHGIGMTDLVKRATVAAAELTDAEYRTGLARVERLVRWLRPGGICFVGLAGWRAAVDRRAQPGRQSEHLGGVPVYVMPSTSGLNARTSLGQLEGHLRAAAAVG